MSTENKKLMLYGFKDLDLQVKKLEMVELSLREDIETYMYMLEDKKENSSAEDVRFIMLDLLTAIRRNATALDGFIDDMKKASVRKLKEDNPRAGEIEIYFNEDFKKQFAKW